MALWRRTRLLLFVSVLCVVFTGSASALQFFGVEEEIRIGSDIAAELEAEHGLYHHRSWNGSIDRMGNELAAVSARPDLPYTFRILDDDQINALAVPGGFIYVYRGLFDAIDTNDELAAVLAHEVAHVANRHGMNQLERNLIVSLGLGLVLRLVFGADGQSLLWDLASGLGMDLLIKGYSRENEFDADRTGIHLMQRAGYDPRGMISFLEKLQRMEARQPSRLAVWFSTHPPTHERIDAIEAAIR